ncbi:hypothetical protein DPMN_178489 [Dreissena polymorpha]|uniref:Uncharacterized protein n=1 Tax=Dreissena polymorpha TaxID=45954 RepID=A0A9D4ILG5_DREPO|nr:hypothetical protein DPMN_178489 [Dreissena polymorpha]
MPAKFGPTLLSAFAFNPVRQIYSSASKDDTIHFAATVSSCLLAKRIPRNCDSTSGKTRKSIGAKSGLPAEVTGHHKLYSMTDSETALNTRPVVSRGSVSLQITRN